MIRTRPTSGNGKQIRALLSSLAIAIHERSSQTQGLANLQESSLLEPENVTSQQCLLLRGQDSTSFANPTEVCIVYLREKIAQLRGLVDAIS